MEKLKATVLFGSLLLIACSISYKIALESASRVYRKDLIQISVIHEREYKIKNGEAQRKREHLWKLIQDGRQTSREADKAREQRNQRGGRESGDKRVPSLPELPVENYGDRSILQFASRANVDLVQ